MPIYMHIYMLRPPVGFGPLTASAHVGYGLPLASAHLFIVLFYVIFGPLIHCPVLNVIYLYLKKYIH